jgi:hypothetical protein
MVKPNAEGLAIGRGKGRVGEKRRLPHPYSEHFSSGATSRGAYGGNVSDVMNKRTGR